MYQLLFKHFTMMFSMALPKNKVGGPVWKHRFSGNPDCIVNTAKR
jgi:hypothetical protein